MVRILLAVVVSTVALEPEASVRTMERVAGSCAVGGRTFRVALQIKQSRAGGAPDPDFGETVSVDGKEGWIHTQEDFQAVGLHQAG